MVISYPRPPFSNPAIQPEDYQPSVFDISDVTRGITTLVETSEDHNYVIGQEVRFHIPSNYGIRQLSGKKAFVSSIPSNNQFIAEINSLTYDAFTNPGIGTPAQVAAIGDVNTGNPDNNNALSIPTFIPGSFINISP